MSNYGWLTESTLIPSKPKKIDGVTSKVAIDQLKALINTRRRDVQDNRADNETNRIQGRVERKGESDIYSKGLEKRMYRDRLASKKDEKRQIISVRKAEHYKKIKMGEASPQGECLLAADGYEEYVQPSGVLIAPPVAFGGLQGEEDRNLDTEKVPQITKFDQDVLTEIDKMMIDKDSIKKIEKGENLKKGTSATHKYVEDRLEKMKKRMNKE